MQFTSWVFVVSITLISVFGLGSFVFLLTFIVTFLCGVITILYLSYDERKIFDCDIHALDNPLERSNFSIQLPKVVDLFENPPQMPKFDHRITGSETVDTFLNEIISIIIADYVTPWYEILTSDEEFTKVSVKQTVITASAHLANRVKSVDWIHVLSIKFPEELTTHLKLFKQARVRMKHVNMLNAKELSNGSITKTTPKKGEDKKTHRRNKSDTDANWLTENISTHVFGKSKFYASTESLNGKTLSEIFFDLESLMEEKKICRDSFCLEADKEYALLYEIAEALLYLIATEEVWKCHPLKLILIDLLSGVVLKPVFSLLSDPDNINRVIIRMCHRDGGLPTELFLSVIRCCEDAEELDATLELVQKEIQKLHSKDSVGECELPVRQQLSSLQYLTRIIHARRVTLGPQEGLFSSSDAALNSNSLKDQEDVKRSLQFLSATTAWRANAQYLLEIELNDAETCYSKSVLDNLRSTALELCDTYLAPNTPTILGLPENCYANLVSKITTDNDEFTNNPIICFDDLQKSIFDALEDVPMWQSSQYSEVDSDSNADKAESDRESKPDKKKHKSLFHKYLKKLPKLFGRRKPNVFDDLPPKSSTFPRCVTRKTDKKKSFTLPMTKSVANDELTVTQSIYSRHNRSRSDIGMQSLRIGTTDGGSSSTSNLSSSSSVSVSQSELDKQATKSSLLMACIIETALHQDKGKQFGIYAIEVTRLSDNKVWHIYRRYSDFYDLHTSIKEKWPELSHLPFPGKKTFSNTSRSVLERRKVMLNNYLQSLTNLVKEPRYAPMLNEEYLGSFLRPGIQEKQSSTIDALLVNSLRAGMRTLKSMPDHVVSTVDGVMDGISKVFQGKSVESLYPEGLKTQDNTEEGDDSVALRLLEEALGIRGLWLRRRLLAPLRTILADRINRKVLELVSVVTSPRNIVQYLKYFKQWLTSRGHGNWGTRDQATKARTRVAAKVALLAACSDDLKHLVGLDSARRGLLTVFELFQSQEINKRLMFVLLEAILTNLFPDNEFPSFFRRLYQNSTRVNTPRKQTSV